jgi:hypothetical protein
LILQVTLPSVDEAFDFFSRQWESDDDEDDKKPATGEEVKPETEAADGEAATEEAEPKVGLSTVTLITCSC